MNLAAVMSSRRDGGATLIEMMVALGLGALVITMLLSLYSLATEAVYRYDLRYSLHRSIDHFESLFRRQLTYAHFHPRCLQRLPDRRDLIVGSGVEASQIERFMQPIAVSSAGAVKALESGVNRTFVDVRMDQWLGKQVRNRIVGSDALLLSQLVDLPWRYIDGAIVDRHDRSPIAAKYGHPSVIYVTDCHRHLLLPLRRRGKSVELDREGKRLMERYFPDKRMLQFYRQESYFLALRREAGERVLVQDFMDGQAFFKSEHPLYLRLHFYYSPEDRWVSAEQFQADKWYLYNGVAVDLILMAGKQERRAHRWIDLTTSLIPYKHEQGVLVKQPLSEWVKAHIVLKFENL